jgi:DNA-binding beta-propeller fold protein YncE
MRACPEGVLVYEGAIYDSVRLFDHEGNYLRTVYPSPADKLAGFKDLNWRTFPQDGASLPAKQWFRQATLLTSGDNSNTPFRGFGEQRFAHDGHGASAGHHAASAMAVRGDKVALAMIRLNRFTTAGASVGGALGGPTLSFDCLKTGYYSDEAKKVVTVGPSSAVLSPDAKWLYSTGYTWISLWGTGGRRNRWLPGVVRTPYEGDGKAEVLIGSIVLGQDGKDDTHFNVPASIDCDPAGRIYVADYMNDRVQVFTPDGKLYKTLPVSKPAEVRVHQRTGDIYVFSWVVGSWQLQADESKPKIPARMFRFGPIDKPGAPAEFAVPLVNYGETCSPWTSGLHYSVDLDSWADEPTIWLYPGSYVLENFTGYAGQVRGQPYWQTSGIQMLTIKDGKLAVKRDFGEEAAKAVKRSRRVAGTNRNLCVDPTTGRLYVGDGSSGEGFSWSLSVEIDPRTGRSRLIDLPFDCEQMVFDIDGHAYLRARGMIDRFSPSDWREVPWDYGEEREGVATASSQNFGPGYRQSGKLSSCLVVPYWEHAPQGTFSISPKGHIVIPIKGRASTIGDLAIRKTEEEHVSKVKKYEFQLYPGRSISGLVLVLDDRGRLIYDDAVPGLTYTHGIKIDKDDNLYAMALANRVVNGQPYYDPAAETLIKFRPKAAKVLATHKDAVPVPMKDPPKRAPDMLGGGKTGVSAGWVQNADWFFGGVGYNGEHHKNPDYGCDCCFSSFDLDYFARSFVPEVEHCSVAVLDSSGNVICRVGKYGNVEDGQPTVGDGGPAKTQATSVDDQVALFYAPHVAVHTDHRLFIADVGNERILSVKLEYHASETVGLK